MLPDFLPEIHALMLEAAVFMLDMIKHDGYAYVEGNPLSFRDLEGWTSLGASVGLVVSSKTTR